MTLWSALPALVVEAAQDRIVLPEAADETPWLNIIRDAAGTRQDQWTQKRSGNELRLVMSEAVMMGLGPYIGREFAHDLVYDICREALKQKRHLIELLAEHPEINKHVTREQLEGFCDPMNNLGQAGVMVDRVLNSLKD